MTARSTPHVRSPPGAWRAIPRRRPWPRRGEKGLPRHPLRVGDPLLVGPRIAAGGALRFDDRPLGPAQPVIDLGKLALILGLYSEMRDAGNPAPALADREIDAGIVQHPLRIIVLEHGRLGCEQGRVEP